MIGKSLRGEGVQRGAVLLASIAALDALCGCASPYGSPGQSTLAAPGATRDPAPILAASQTVDVESADRIARFQRLAGLGGVATPAVTQVLVTPSEAPGLDAPVPVVRVVFPEQALFDFDADTPRIGVGAILDLVAENMRRDVPDAQLTLLGHTDAIGSEQYNYALSARRARAVFQALVERGVDPAQLSTVAIGKDQPIAPNDTAEGRARNRRVEFLISAYLNANLAVVRRQPAVAAPRPGPAHTADRPTHVRVAVLRPAVSAVAVPAALPVAAAAAPAAVTAATPHHDVALRPLGGLDLPVVPAPALGAAAPDAAPQVKLNTPRDVQPAPLGPALSY